MFSEVMSYFYYRVADANIGNIQRNGSQFWQIWRIWYRKNEMQRRRYVKFICSEKATKFCEISTLDLSYIVTVKSTVEISQNFVAFSEYMNFTIYDVHTCY